jgi:hypothetical protein
MRMLLALPLIVLAACSTGSQGDYMSPEDVAAGRSYSYTGPSTDLNAPVQGDAGACPEAMPTGGALHNDHEGVGSFFCDF